jgi:hypothetical protein
MGPSRTYHTCHQKQHPSRETVPLNAVFVLAGATSNGATSNGAAQRASVENLQDFLSKMDTSIAAHKRNTLTIINKSRIGGEEEGGHPLPSNNNSRPPVTDPFHHHVC